MTLRLFNRRSQQDLRGELCLEPEVMTLMQENETLEQKVTRIFQALRLPVYYYLMAFLGDAATADDLTQEVFLRLYAHLHRGRAVENARLWVFRVAHNLAFDERQRHQRLVQLDAPTWDDVRANLPDPALNPEQRALQRERLERMHAALQWLSAQERQCLLLRAEGLRYREIGEILGVGTSTVGEFLQRALRKLMKINVEN
jgi:RNA polymerase sigma-70 factor (ECF subfamily)